MLRRILLWVLYAAAVADMPSIRGVAQGDGQIHGLWVWKGDSVLQAPRGAEKLRDFCRSEGINEVYISVAAQEDAAAEARLAHLAGLLHREKVKVEALLDSNNADEPGTHRDKLLERVRGVVRFNQGHIQDQVDGIHLDIEPQQRTENKGEGNLRFLPGLVEAYRAARKEAEPARLTVNADIQKKLLKGSLEQRRMLLSALPRLTLMLYEVDSGGGSETDAQKADKLRTASTKSLEMAYAGLSGSKLARMTIGLRTPDYGDSLPRMLAALDQANTANAHYGGWARHSYNDWLAARR